jgi:hypothetical protein
MPEDCSAEEACEDGECTDAADVAPSASKSPAASLPIDDFEDANEFPRDPFDVWIGHTYNPSGQYGRLRIQEPGRESLAALYFDWRVDDVENGRQEFPGAGLETHVLNGSVDLSTYSRLRFSQRFEPGIDAIELDDPVGLGLDACTSERQMTVILECDDYPGAPPLDESGRPPGYEAQVRLSPTWTTEQVSFEELYEPTWRPPTGVPLAGCLGATTGLYFQLQTGLVDGQCAAGRLVLDDIVFF